MTGGQGEYTLEFLRYEEIPAHLAQKVADKAARRGRSRRIEALRRGEGGHCYPRPPVMARTRDIRTNQLDIACDVCGRTLLRGEHAEHFLAGGERRLVCDLCTARAQHEGWIRESGADDLELRHPRHEGRSFIDRLRAGRRERPPRDRRGRARAASPSRSRAAAREPRRRRAASRRARVAQPHPRGADQRRAQDAARARRLQRLRPHAHGRRRRPLARRARRLRAPARRTAPRSSRSP